MKLSEYPLLVAEWDAETNAQNGLFLEKLSHGSTKTAAWVCPKGHHFSARIDHRTIMGSGCPYCAGLKPIIGENDLATLFPEIAGEWDYSCNPKSPSEYLPQSNKKMSWNCTTCGNKYITSIQHRTQGGGCPKCARKLRGIAKRATAVRQTGSIVQTHPEIAAEWDYEKNAPLQPDNVTAGCKEKVWWTGKECGHSYDMTVQNRCISDMGCPVCAGKRLLVGFNDLATTHPGIARCWHPKLNGDLQPTDILYGTDRKVWWQCEKGHEWQTAPYAKFGCPECAKVLRTSFPEQSVLYYLKKVTQARSREIIYGREVDIWLPEYNCSIEYNGQYWHKERQDKDLEKARELRRRGIRHFVIHEGCVGGFDGDEIFYKFVSAEHATLGEIIRYIFERLGLPCIDIDIVRDAAEIRAQYYQHREKSIASEYPQLLPDWDVEANWPLTPDMISYGSKQKVFWKCAQCFCTEWTSAQNRVRRGCPTCHMQKT